MAFIPIIEVSYNRDNGSFTVMDTTGGYDVDINPNGYGGPNTPRNAVEGAKLYILFNRNSFKEIDVTDIIRSASEDVIELGVFLEGEEKEDGIYRFHLFFKEGTDDYLTLGKQVFISEEAEQLVSEFWAKLASLHDIYRKKPLEKECIWLESNLGILESLKERNKEKQFLNLLAFIHKRISVNLSLIK